MDVWQGVQTVDTSHTPMVRRQQAFVNYLNVKNGGVYYTTHKPEFQRQPMVMSNWSCFRCWCSAWACARAENILTTHVSVVCLGQESSTQPKRTLRSAASVFLRARGSWPALEVRRTAGVVESAAGLPFLQKRTRKHGACTHSVPC